MKKKSKRRIVFIIILVLCLIAGGLFAAKHIAKNDDMANITYTVRNETYENFIDIAGIISAAQEQKLQAAGDGSVKSVYVKEGDIVKKGDTILQLDDTEQQYNLLRHDYDMQQKRITGSLKEYQLMQKQRTVLLQRILDRKVIANFDGIIASFTVTDGDYFEAKDEVGIIVDRSYLRAEVEVVETDAPKLKVGQKVIFKFPAYQEFEIEGHVVSFPAVGTVTSRGATVVKAEVRIETPPEEILPNYSFTGKIEIKPPETFLLVEQQAIGYENGKPFAERIRENGAHERIDVQVRPYGQGFVRILSGLNEGDILAAQEIGMVSGPVRRNGGVAGMPRGGRR